MAPVWLQLGASLLVVIGWCSFGLVKAAAPVIGGTINFVVDLSINLVAKTWYRIHGYLETSKHSPLVVLHGGPGASSDYLWLLQGLTEQDGIPVIFYNQVGNGRSTHFPERRGDADFWTEELFRNELTNLLSALGISNRPYDILGQSWGGMLGASFATYRPKNLRRLILSSPLASMDLFYIQSVNGLRAQLPQNVQDALARKEKAGTFNSTVQNTPQQSRCLMISHEEIAYISYFFLVLHSINTISLTQCRTLTQMYFTLVCTKYNANNSRHRVSASLAKFLREMLEGTPPPPPPTLPTVDTFMKARYCMYIRHCVIVKALVTLSGDTMGFDVLRICM